MKVLAKASAHCARKKKALSILLGCLMSLATLEAAAQQAPLGADPPAREPRSDTWDLTGEARLRFVGMRDFGLDTTGATAGRTAWMESRLVAGATFRPIKVLDIVLEIDALNGPFAGDLTNTGIARGYDTFNMRRDQAFGGGAFLPRKIYLSLDGPFVRILLGQQAFDWGMGLLANDGVGDPDFGDMYQGNLVERIAFVTQPLKRSTSVPDWLRGLTAFLAADLVFRDDNASVLAGDIAWTATLGLRLATPRFQVGLLEVMRRQYDRPEPGRARESQANVWVTDLYGRLFLTRPSAPHTLQLETEMALIAGDTTRPFLEETSARGAGVLSFGGAARLRFDSAPLRLTAKVEAGYASGDNDSRDNTARQFSFHTDYNVGLVLFDHVLPMLTARAVDRLVDPGLVAVRPLSVRFLVNQGAVSNALYLNPTVRLRPVPRLELRLGYVLAESDADLIDPYSSAKNGGYNANFNGESPGSRSLGQEVDLGARVSFDLGAGVTLRAGYEAGFFFPGDALKNVVDDKPIWTARALSDVSF